MMVTKDYLFGFGTALIAFAIIEGICLLVALSENKKLKISKISEDANETVNKLSDKELLDKLSDDFKSDG